MESQLTEYQFYFGQQKLMDRL